MGRAVSTLYLSTIAALAGVVPAMAAETAPAAPVAPAAPAPAQPAATSPEQAPAEPAPAADSIALLCKGLYVVPNSQVAGVPTDTGQKTQFTIRISYANRYMDLKAAEWPSLVPAKDNPSVVRSATFVYDDDVVKASFAPQGSDFRGALFSLGLSKMAGDYEEAIVLNRKTGDFTYPNTTGHCEKVEVKENKF
ncbi:MAG: hypothetical protein GC201_10090 [Alphaproteobacteria bacterium]|nr:hypothetical protein [Alphaproteobacteria bacterium]